MIRAFLILTLLAGCATSSESFDCDPGKGLGCKSITEVNQIIDKEEALDQIHDYSPASLVTPDHGSTTSIAQGRGISITHGLQRLPEQVMSVWVAPFEDGEGNFHEESVIHSVVQKSRWKVAS